MEITPAQLDAIATKLLGWTKAYAGDVQNVYHPMPGIKTVTRTLYTHDPADAMLVLESMGKWCDADPRLLRVSLESCGNEWICEIIQHLDEESDDTLESELGATIPAAVFACAAQLVGRM